MQSLARSSLIRSLPLTLASAILATSVGAAAQDWTVQFGTPESDEAAGMAPDGSGGVFIAGSTRGALGAPVSGFVDGWCARYDSTGAQLWVRQTGSSASDGFSGAAHDGSGGVFLAGFYDSGPVSGSEAWLARYDGSGTELWSLRLDSGQLDRANAVTADGAGGAFVAGRTEGQLGANSFGTLDAWLARYDGQGNQIWIRQFGTTEWDEATAAAGDGAGGVYVCGWTNGAIGAPLGARDGWIARYDAAGARLWLRQIGSPGSDQADAVITDGVGGAYLAGWTSGALGGPAIGSTDAWVARLDSAGNVTWTRQFGGRSTDLLFDAAPDANGGVFLCGTTSSHFGDSNAGMKDAWYARYDAAGTQLLLRQFGGDLDDDARAAASDGAGGLYFAGVTRSDLGPLPQGGHDAWLAHRSSEYVATRYCSPNEPNSTGGRGIINASGSLIAADDELTLHAYQLPINRPGYFLASMSQGFLPGPGGSDGNLCLGAPVGRLNIPGGYPLQNSGPAGSIETVIDLTALPLPTGFAPVLGGQTWNFQCWYRDFNPFPTSNLTDAVSITFQ